MGEAVDHLRNGISFSGVAVAEERHEYIDGQAFAMTGASESHEIVASNRFAVIH